MGVREHVTSVAAYGLVALASAMVVSGGTLSQALRAAFHTPDLTAAAPATAVAGARVVAPAVTARPAPSDAGSMASPLPDIPGANGAATTAARPAAPIRTAPVHTPAAPVASETGSASLDATLRLARWLTQQWYDSSLDAVWASFSPAVKAQWKSEGDFRAFRAGGVRAYGAETAVLAEELTPHGDVTYYTRTASFERGPKGGWTLIIGLDGSGQVRDFGVVGASLLPARMNALLR